MDIGEAFRIVLGQDLSNCWICWSVRIARPRAMLMIC